MPPQFPVVERVELRKPPLELVVCQLRFPTLLELAGNQPPLEFQRRIADSYPIAHRKRQSELELTSDSGPRMSVSQFWSFETAESDWLVSLGTTWLALEAKRYRMFDEFVARFLTIVGHATELYRLRVQDRLGLRYIDRISKNQFPELPDNWLDLIRQDLIPLRGLRGAGDAIVSNVESRLCFGNRFLTIRCGFVDATFPGANCDELTLDFDCFTEQRAPLDTLEAQLRDFKSLSYNAFRWAVGDLITHFPPAAPEVGQ
jgi:uncharacterized protein (TIGR04255 family)